MSIFIYFIAAILLYFLLRELNCWYLKTNKILQEQQKTNYLLSELLKKYEMSKTQQEFDTTNFKQTSLNNSSVLNKILEATSNQKNE